MRVRFLFALMWIAISPLEAQGASMPSADFTKACASPSDPGFKILCGDPVFAQKDAELRELLEEKYVRLTSEAARVLRYDQHGWLPGTVHLCAPYIPSYMTALRIQQAHACLVEKYAARLQFVRALATDTSPKAPYLLSGFTCALLSQGARADPYGDGRDKPDVEAKWMRSALLRVYSAILPQAFIQMTPETWFYLLEAVNNIGRSSIERNRFSYGRSFVRHGGYYRDYFVIVDLKTGEVVVGAARTGEVTLLYKSCIGSDLKDYAAQKLSRVAYEEDKAINIEFYKDTVFKRDPTGGARLPAIKDIVSKCK